MNAASSSQTAPSPGSGEERAFGSQAKVMSASRLVRRAQRRERAQRLFRFSTRGLAFAALASVPVVLIWRRGWFGESAALVILGVLVFIALMTAAYRVRHRRDALEVAVLLDQHSGAPADALRTSFELEAVDPSERGLYAAYHLELHSAFEAGTVGRAFPWKLTSWALIAPLAVLSGVLASQWTPSVSGFEPWSPPPPIARQTFVSASTLFERERLEEIRDEVYRSEEESLIEAFETIQQALDDLEQGDTQHEILAQLQQLAEKLDQLDLPEPAELEDAFEQAADRLDDASETSALAEALRSDDLERAAAELEELDQASEGSPDSQQALRRAAEAMSPFDRSEDRELERAERAVERQRETAGESERADERLEQAEEELERLERERQQAADAQGADQSRRESVSRSLRRLARERASSRQQDERTNAERERSANQDGASASQAGSEALRQQSQEQRAQSAREALRQRADSLRESIQRDGQQPRQSSGGSRRADDMREFLRRAGADMESLPQAGGQQGAGQQGAGQQGAGQQGAGQQGAGRGSENARQLQRLDRERASASESPGSAQTGQQQGSGGQQGAGEGYGEGHRDDQFLHPTQRQEGGRAVQLRGTPDGEGPSSAEIILGAEDGGFAGVPYREVYQRYAEIRESIMERESIPSGYRYYVERYFELISPRTSNPR